ncbi:chain-length determining protein, partial [Pseudomonas nabeulensis]
MSSSFRIPPVSPLVEADLSELVRIIWHQKRLIALVVGVCALLAVAYIFFATPRYQVSSVLRPAAINELDALNRSEIYRLPPR